MDISSVNSDLIRGNVTTIILGCLKNEDKYGYEILKEIEDKSHSQYALKQATLYNQLKRLEKQGLVTSYDGAPDDTGGGKRRYYALTPEGKNYLTKEKDEYEYARTILDKLVSDSEFDFTKDIPFDASELRPYSKRGESDEKPKIVYKDKIVEVERIVEKPVERIIEKEVPVERIIEREIPVERIVEIEKEVPVEKTVEIEKKIYIDRFGNPVTEEEYEHISRQALIEDEQVRKTEQELASTLEKLRTFEEEQTKTAEQLRLLEEDRIAYEEQLRVSEEDRKSKEEQLRAFEENRISYEEQLRLAEEERLAKEAELRASEQQRLAAEEELRKLQEERRDEEERRRIAQTRPSSTVEELFEKLEAQSEYNYSSAQTAPAKTDVEEQVFFESAVEEEERQGTLQDLFRKLDKREAEIEEERVRREEETVKNEVASDVLVSRYDSLDYVESELESENSENDSYVTSAVVTHREDGFEYEKNNVNYRDFFTSIVDIPEPKQEQTETQNSQAQYTDADIKTRLYAKGFKIRPYDKGNTSEYYTYNFIQSNRINRDTFLIVMAFFLAEMAVMWVSLASRISYTYFLPITLVCSVLCLIPTVLYLANPTKRIRANFNFKLSLLNRLMMFIELTLVCVLVGFFALGASVKDIDLILMSMIIPAVILLNLPISSIIYWLLYRTRKYHIA